MALGVEHIKVGRTLDQYIHYGNATHTYSCLQMRQGFECRQAVKEYEQTDRHDCSAVFIQFKVSKIGHGRLNWK